MIKVRWKNYYNPNKQRIEECADGLYIVEDGARLPDGVADVRLGPFPPGTVFLPKEDYPVPEYSRDNEGKVFMVDDFLM